MWHLYEDTKGNIWIGTHGGGLNVLAPDSGIFTHYRHNPDDSSTISSDIVGPIFEDSKGNFWVGSLGGLNKMDRESGTFTRYQHNKDNKTSLPNNHVWDFFEDDNGYIWIGSFGGGVSRFKPEEMVFHPYQNQANNISSLSSNLVWCLITSNDGVLWVGTDGGGLNKFSPLTLQFNHHVKNPLVAGSLTYNGVNAVSEDESGRLWMANDGGGIQYLDLISDESRQFVHEPGNPNTLNSDLTETLLIDHSGIIWIGTYNGGLTAYNPRTEKFSHYMNDQDDSTSLSDNRIWSIFEDSKHFLWVGTRNGLNRIDPSRTTIQRFFHDSQKPGSISDNGIWIIYEDQSGTIWIGTDNGLNVLKDDNTFEHFYNEAKNPTSLSHNNITALYESHDHSFWIGTNGGLNKLNRKTHTITRYTKKDGLASNSIRGILEDSQNNLWITTVKGLTKFSPAKNEFHTYQYRDGLQGTEFSRAAHLLRNNTFVVGGRNGINVFDPLKVTNNPHIPPVVLTGFTTIDTKGKRETKHEQSAFSLSYKETTIMLDFAALDFNHSAANLYMYMLEGFDTEWVNAGHRHQATYTNLGGGEYSLRIRGSNNHGIWNREGLTVPISITYPPWQRWWAYLIYVSALILSILLFVEMRARQHLKELALAEKTNRELKKEVRARKKAEEALVLSEQRLTLALNAAKEGIWELNPQTGEAYFSPVWFTMLGYEADSFTHTRENWINLTHPDDRPKVLDHLEKYLTGKTKEYAIEFRMHAKDASWIWIFATGEILEYNTTNKPIKMVGIHMDISSRKESEQERQNLEAALQHASKMEAIGTLAGGIAHDFNNILSAIIGNCELGMLSLDKGAPLQRRFEQILQAGFRAKDLIQQILTFSRKEKRELQAVDIGLLIEEALSLLRSTIPTTISIEKQLSSNVCPVIADPTQIHQVIVNLCTNASHAMEETGGVLTVELNTLTISKDGREQFPGKAPGSYSEIRISDTGEGIPPDDINNIFNPYFSKKKLGKGSGLGLSVVQGIVQNCGGDIHVDSTQGVGSTFTVLLPWAPNEENLPVPESKANQENELQPLTGHFTILVLDDESVIVDVVKAQLEEYGHKVFAFTSAEDAVESIRKDPTFCNLIITDMAMPEITGIQVAQEVKKCRPDMPVILCTGYNKKVFSCTPEELGVDTVLLKPVRINELLQSIHVLLSEIDTTGSQ